MSERQARRVRQEMRRRFKTDWDDFTSLVSTFSLWFRVKFCVELLCGKRWKQMVTLFKREKRGV